jgi:hypothetical protein
LSCLVQEAADSLHIDVVDLAGTTTAPQPDDDYTDKSSYDDGDGYTDSGMTVQGCGGLSHHHRRPPTTTSSSSPCKPVARGGVHRHRQGVGRLMAMFCLVFFVFLLQTETRPRTRLCLHCNARRGVEGAHCTCLLLATVCVSDEHFCSSE